MIGQREIRWGLGGLLGLLLVVAVIGSRPLGYWASEGYVRQANELIRTGLLALECGVQDRIVVAPMEPGSPAADFYYSSFLRADVRAFNDGPDDGRTPFLVEGCELKGVDPYYHRVDLPFNRLPRWRGDVRLRGADVAATLEASGRDQLLQVRHAVGGADAARAASVSPATEGARTQTPLLHLLRPRGAEVTADFFMVGDALVLADRRDIGAADHIRVNGFRTPPGRRLRIASGDWLQFGFGAGAEYTYIAETGERARIASFVRGVGGGVERLYPVPRLRPFVEPLARAMDGALQTIPAARDDGSRVVTRNIDLTLDRELGDALDRRVAAWCTGFQNADRPRAASLIVMDARSGAVRAMPSCPGEPELEPFEPLTPRARQRFLRNQNLVAHPIGSAGKPFWAAAVASTFPNFLDLEVPAHAAGPQAEALGCALADPYRDEAHGHDDGWVGMEEFLQRSCNRYLIEYATAALAVAGSPAAAECRRELAAGRVANCFAPAPTNAQRARIRFCGNETEVAHTGATAVRGNCAGLQLVESAFAPAPSLGALANIAWYRDPSPSQDAAAGLTDAYRRGRYRLDAWTPVLAALDAAGDTAHQVQTSLRFAAVSPEATNLALNTVDELRQDWINLLLGGENSRWSNFQLAEALARLMTGRDVRGTFVADSIAQSADVLAADVLHPGARRRVLHALELVAQPGGTAGRLSRALDALEQRVAAATPGQRWELYAFAKTGTPAVELIQQGRRMNRQGGVVVLGLLAVPAERGRAAAARVRDWISACRLPDALERSIFEVPRADMIAEDAVALSIALYADDLPEGQGASVAVTLAERALPDIGDYMVQRVREAAARRR